MADSRRGKEGIEDTELADISLLNRRDELPSEAHSWYSANGRGYSVNGRQTEYEGDTSHVASVLGEEYYARQKRNQAIKDFISQKPHPAFNMPSVVLAALVVVLLIIVGSQRSHLDSPPESDSQSIVAPSDSDLSPEGAFGADSYAYDYRGWSRQIQSPNGAVAADHSRCSVIGVGVLQAGGNAVDSAIATCLCQGLMSPVASGLGGGHFMLVRLPNGTAEFVDARETAPSHANETMFVGNPASATRGGLSIGVPLELKGLWLAHQRYGKASWRSLVEPAINIAELGFRVQPYLMRKIQQHIDRMREDPALRDVFLIKEKDVWRAPMLNESCCARPQLAVLLGEIAEQGPDALYRSPKTQALAAEIQAAGGIITVDDLQQAQPVVQPALRSQAFGMDVLTPGPPSSGAALVTALHIMQGYPEWQAFTGELAAHRLVESMKSAFAVRTHLADPGVCTEPMGSNASGCYSNMTLIVQDALSTEFADQLREALLDNSTQSSNMYGGSLKANSTVPEDGGTSHMSVVDKDGMAVGLTSTINLAFGSYVYSPSTEDAGLLLNDEMDDFSTPGMGNSLGLSPSISNFIRPGKRPLSSMVPTILADEQGVRVVVGAGGGPRIISAVLSTIIRLVVYGQKPLAAISAPRLHHQLLPDVVYAESWQGPGVSYVTSNSTIAALQSRGHNVSLSSWAGVTQAIVIDPSTRTLIAASDPRKDGAPAGY